MKKLLKFLFLLIIFIAVLAFPVMPASAAQKTEEPDINAKGCALIDADTGAVLYSKNLDEQFEPASTTKVMTALLVLEKCSLDEKVSITQDFTEIDGTAVGLLKGDIVSVEDLLKGLMLESGNDCANALAIHVSGSIEEFAELMNQRAKELGAQNTNFENPSGLPGDNHKTTAYDLTLFLREAVKNEDFVRITRIPMSNINLLNDSEKEIVVNNKNHTIDKTSQYYYEYALCGKNGYTISADHTYVSCAEKDGHRLIGAFLCAKDKNQNFEDMKKVFNYGFNNFTYKSLCDTNEIVAHYDINNEESIPLKLENTLYFPVKKDSGDSLPKFEIKPVDKDLSNESFKKDDVIMQGELFVDGRKTNTLNLVSNVSRAAYPGDFGTETEEKTSIIIYVIRIIAGIFTLLLAVRLFNDLRFGRIKKRILKKRKAALKAKKLQQKRDKNRKYKELYRTIALDSEETVSKSRQHSKAKPERAGRPKANVSARHPKKNSSGKLIRK